MDSYGSICLIEIIFEFDQKIHEIFKENKTYRFFQLMDQGSTHIQSC
jgi:hypothetical protein